MGPFREALRDIGYIDGQTIQLDMQVANGRIDRLPAMAEELVRSRVDIIIASQTPAVIAAKTPRAIFQSSWGQRAIRSGRD